VPLGAPAREQGPSFGAVLATAVASPAVPPPPPRPRIIALVGPTGAGKTTTIAKLAANREIGLGSGKAGLLGLDTYRVGAAEQLRAWAALIDLPCEIVHESADLERAMRRLQQCSTVLVDTPGRGPSRGVDAETVRGWLQRLTPDEVHLVLPAGRMPMVTRQSIEEFGSWGVTHVLPTKLDECPEDIRLFDVAIERKLPMRWMANGQEVPADLHAATALYTAAADRLQRRGKVAA
jgi:flagellar biosynthesis protein FlhF